MLILGRVASVISILMYVSYLAQIMSNLAGQHGNPLQPLIAAINASFWDAYGLKKERTDWPVVIANAPGIVLGLITFITSF